MIQLHRDPILFIILLLGLAIYNIRRKKRRNRSINKARTLPSSTPSTSKSKPTNHAATTPASSYHHIEPLPNFNLSATAPIKIRPFKPKYHLTMALENTTISDLIAMDNTYASRIAIRKALITNQPQDVLAVNPKAAAAVLEFYGWVIGTYLPGRFPELYEVRGKEEGEGLWNSATQELLPLRVDDARLALEIIGANIDTDFLFLLPSASSCSPSADTKYRLEAFVTCFPSGFSTPQKLNMLLSEIHGPVPGYAAKLERSMDRFFASLPVGKVVKRVNWSVTTHRRLFCFEGNHGSEEDFTEEEGGGDGSGKNKEEEEVDMDETVLRCERQTLHRLPGSKALVFAFKTYQDGMRALREELRQEEDGVEAFCQAIDGLGTGNVPGMTVYKRQVVWGERVKGFMRGEME